MITTQSNDAEGKKEGIDRTDRIESLVHQPLVVVLKMVGRD